MSATGQYILFGNGGTDVYLSSDYGNTARLVYNNGNATGGSIKTSSSGQYVTLNMGDHIVISTNYGLTNSWITYTWIVANGYPNINEITMSSTGQYQYGIGSYATNIDGGSSFYYSSNYGYNFNYVNLTNNNVFFSDRNGAYNNQLITCDGTGQYLYIVNQNNQLSYSTNYGFSWTTSGTAIYSCVAASSNGSYVMIPTQNGVYVSNMLFTVNTVATTFNPNDNFLSINGNIKTTGTTQCIIEW